MTGPATGHRTRERSRWDLSPNLLVLDSVFDSIPFFPLKIQVFITLEVVQVGKGLRI